MKKKLLNTLKYLVTLAIAIGIFLYLFKNVDFAELVEKLKTANYFWIGLSMFIAILSHYLRALRWNLLLKPIGYQPTSFRTFLAVMSGYFFNMIFPRMGEVTRCGVLKKTDNVPMTSSVGSVVTERVIDLVCLIISIFIAVVVEYDTLRLFLLDFFQEKFLKLDNSRQVIIIGALVFLLSIALAVFIFIRFKEKILSNTFVQKVITFSKEVFNGMLSVAKVKNKFAFVLLTIGIWVLYFLMSYVMFFTLPETSHLTIGAGLSILVMGGLGMTAPVQGGIGTFHALVSATLGLYGLTNSDGVIFATILHSSQVLMVLVLGGAAFAISLLLKPKDNPDELSGQNS